MERKTQTVWIESKPNFEIGETDKLWNERFNREFENTLLDTFFPDKAMRCVDIYGDEGWIVGHHAEIPLPCGSSTRRNRIEPFTWILRDRDNALMGVHDGRFKKI